MPTPTPVTQSRLLAIVLPLLQKTPQRYDKFCQVRARPAEPGELVVTITGDGEETRNRAGDDHLVLQNLTAAGEYYLMRRQTFVSRYRWVEDVDHQWKLYNPVSQILALEISAAVRATLDVDEQFYIEAPWGSLQVAREGDWLATPWPALGEVYRIARREFRETYRASPAER